jgi:hypothetical protein
VNQTRGCENRPFSSAPRGKSTKVEVAPDASPQLPERLVGSKPTTPSSIHCMQPTFAVRIHDVMSLVLRPEKYSHSRR